MVMETVKRQLVAHVQIDKYGADETHCKSKQVNGRKQFLPAEVANEQKEIISDYIREGNLSFYMAKAIPDTVHRNHA